MKTTQRTRSGRHFLTQTIACSAASLSGSGARLRLFAVLLVNLLTLSVLHADDEPATAMADLLRIDAHSHVFEDIPELNALLHRLNIRTINICNNGTTEHFAAMHQIALNLFRTHPDLYPFEATFDLNGRDKPGYVAEVIAFLDGMFEQGAVGVKIWKDVGLGIQRPDGSYILPDDPIFDPIYAHLAARGKPLHAHLAEPIEAWLPLDPESAHYSYYSTHPEWHLLGKPGFPSHAAIIAARDRIMEKHPKLVVIGAHLGSLEHDLEGLGRRFDRFPHFYVDCAARTRDLTRQPSDAVRALFVKYPDRILYGVDASWKPFRDAVPPTIAQRQAHVARLEARYLSDYDYYAGRGEVEYDGRRVEALNLPRSVLKKFYNGNARRVFKLDSVAVPPVLTGNKPLPPLP